MSAIMKAGRDRPARRRSVVQAATSPAASGPDATIAARDDGSVRRDPPPPGRPAATRDPERTSAAILAAAVEEFSENGFGGARIDSIAARAGVNKRMLYHYFGDKDALYERVLQSIYDGIRSAEHRLNLRDRDPTEGIRELALFTWRYFIEHPEFLSLLATENMNRGRVLRGATWAPAVNSPLVGVLSDLLERGAAQGVFRPGLDPVDVYVTLAGVGWFYLSNRYTLSASFNRDFNDPAELARWGDHMADVAIAAIAAR